MSQQNQTEKAVLKPVTEDDIARALGQYCVITVGQRRRGVLHPRSVHSQQGRCE